MQTVSIELPAELAEQVRGHVAKGRFESEMHVVCEALQQMEDREYDSKLQFLRDALAEGVRQAQDDECVEYSMQEIINELEAEQ